MKLLSTIAVMVATVFATCTAHADPAVGYRTGKWWTGFQHSDDGNPMCRMSTVAPGNGRAVHVKWMKGQLWVHVWRNTWRIPASATVSLQVQFDGAPALIGDARVFRDMQSIGAPITDDRFGETFREFMEQFAEADRLYLRFADGNEPGWTFDMTGSRDAASLFRACIERLERGNTQPHRATPPIQSTQPHQPRV